MSSYNAIWQQKERDILAVAEQVKNKFPQDWANTNNPTATGREMYIRRVAWGCIGITLAGPNGEVYKIGLNWKRGVVGDLSLDVLACVNPSGAVDKTGGKPGLELVDIIGSHGAPNASLGWNDVTVATINSGNGGGFIQPTDPDTTSLPGTPGTPPATPLKARSQFDPEFKRINGFYAAPEGLQRVGGMVAGVDASVFEVMRKIANGEITDSVTIKNAAQQVLGVQCDVQAMIQWGYDLMAGATPEQIEAAIRGSDEWKAKHPNG